MVDPREGPGGPTPSLIFRSDRAPLTSKSGLGTGQDGVTSPGEYTQQTNFDILKFILGSEACGIKQKK